jgi:hypothetical protein
VPSTNLRPTFPTKVPRHRAKRDGERFRFRTSFGWQANHRSTFPANVSRHSAKRDGDRSHGVSVEHAENTIGGLGTSGEARWQTRPGLM